jgi:hypothetical protein
MLLDTVPYGGTACISNAFESNYPAYSRPFQLTLFRMRC